MFFVLRARGKDIYARSAFKPGIALVGLIAVIATIGNVWLLYADFQASATWTEAWYFTVELLVVGALIYLVYKYVVGKAAGADYTTIYAEVPPE